MELCLALEDLPGLAHTLRHLGDLHQDGGSWSAAGEAYAQALSLYRRLPQTPPAELANVLRPYALLREGLGEAQAAAAMWREARALYASAGIAEGVAECDRHLG